MAASPYRVIDDDVVMEVKCPFAAKDKPITPSTVPYLKLVPGSDELTLDNKHVYYYQVQGQLLCSGRKKCIFVVYTLVDMKTITIHYDVEFAGTGSEFCKSYQDLLFAQYVHVLMKSFCLPAQF